MKEKRRSFEVIFDQIHTTDLVSQIVPPLADLCVPLEFRCHAERGKFTELCKEKVPEMSTGQTCDD